MVSFAATFFPPFYRINLPLSEMIFLKKKMRTLLFREKLAKLFVFRRENRVARGSDPYEEEKVFPQGPTPRRSEKTGASRRGSRRMCRSHSNDAPPRAAPKCFSTSVLQKSGRVYILPTQHSPMGKQRLSGFFSQPPVSAYNPCTAERRPPLRRTGSCGRRGAPSPRTPGSRSPRRLSWR